jgi:hypothetical protein
MSVDFVFVPHSDAHSSYAVSSLFFFDPVFARRQLAAAEEAGFRTVLIDDAAGALANLDIVASVARWNKALDIRYCRSGPSYGRTAGAAHHRLLRRRAGRARLSGGMAEDGRISYAAETPVVE